MLLGLYKELRLLNTDLEIAIYIAKKAGNVLLKYLGDIKSIDYKGAFNIVTNADKESEALIVKIIQENFPEDSILAEEGNNVCSNTSKRLWLIDPLDGTTNYAHAYPFFAVSIGLQLDKEMILGVVYNPCNNELYTAVKNNGAYLNGTKLKVSQIKNINEALLATGFSPDTKNCSQNNKAEFSHLTDVSHGVRRDGAASLDLAYVASGRLEAFWEYNLKPWDLAAGSILVTEAGGVVSDLRGKILDFYQGNVLASNKLIHQTVLTELHEYASLKVK